jgi:hypothetical protein|tara:strand:- start:1379 stop:1603 length:225 start_codon:yes stop_codon:yes gene_type:complete
MKFFHFPSFIIAFSVGLFFTYISRPNTNIIYVYPTPENNKKLLFQDKADNCFQFNARTVNCPSDTNKIKNYKPQ